MASFAVILPAAGRSIRFGGQRSKLLEPIAGVPLFRRTVEAFSRRPDVEGIYVPTSERQHFQDLLRETNPNAKALHFCAGGSTRAASVQNALACVPKDIEWVAVHDAARPLVSQQLIDATFAQAMSHGAAVPALAVSLTIKQAAGPLPAKVKRTLPRHELWAMQTPQIMRRAALASAFDTCPIDLAHVTDDVQLIELAGGDVMLVPGDEHNLKVTTRADIALAERYLAEQSKPSL